MIWACRLPLSMHIEARKTVHWIGKLHTFSTMTSESVLSLLSPELSHCWSRVSTTAQRNTLIKTPTVADAFFPRPELPTESKSASSPSFKMQLDIGAFRRCSSSWANFSESNASLLLSLQIWSRHLLHRSAGTVLNFTLDYTLWLSRLTWIKSAKKG